MVYIALLLMLAIMYGIEHADRKRKARSLASVEKTHQALYDLIDSEYGNTPAQARERKAEVDMIIHTHWNDIGRDYSPASVKEVTTKKERKERDKACNEGRYSAYSAQKFSKAQILDAIDEAIIDKMIAEDPYPPCSEAEGKERAITDMMECLGISREEATKNVERFIETMF